MNKVDIIRKHIGSDEFYDLNGTEMLSKLLTVMDEYAQEQVKLLTIPEVTNRTLKDGRKRAYLQGYRKSAISIEGAYSDQTEIEAKKEFDNWHLNLYGW